MESTGCFGVSYNVLDPQFVLKVDWEKEQGYECTIMQEDDDVEDWTERMVGYPRIFLSLKRDLLQREGEIVEEKIRRIWERVEEDFRFFCTDPSAMETEAILWNMYKSGEEKKKLLLSKFKERYQEKLIAIDPRLVERNILAQIKPELAGKTVLSQNWLNYICDLFCYIGYMIKK